jgi:hypothetical protein
MFKHFISAFLERAKQGLILAASITIVCCGCPRSLGAIIATDDFVYPDGALAGNAGGVGWLSVWSAAQGSPTVQSGEVEINSSAGQQAERILPRQGVPGTSVWIRFVARQFSDGVGPNDTYGGLGLYEGAAERLLIGKMWPGEYLWSSGPGTSTASTLNWTSVYACITFGSQKNDDTLEVWINPSRTASRFDLGAPALSVKAKNLSFDRIRLRGGTGISVNESWRFSYLTVADNLADVAANPALLAHESFSGYTIGNLPGQVLRGSGLASGAWVGTDSHAAIVSEKSLNAITSSSGGRMTLKGDDSAVWANLDLGGGGGFRRAGLLDSTTGVVGGGSIDGTLYLSFLIRALSNDRNNEYGGLQLARQVGDNSGLLIGNSPDAWAFSLYDPQSGNSVDLRQYGGLGGYVNMDNNAHLVVAKIRFRANSEDDCQVWLDPDPMSSEEDQSSNVHTAKLSGDFSFDRFALRSGAPTRPFDFDEIRFGTTFSSVLPLGSPLRLGDDKLDVKLNQDGTIRSMSVLRDGTWENVVFRSDDHRGPAWRITDGKGIRSIPLTLSNADGALYTGTDGDLLFSMRYQVRDGQLIANTEIRNTGTETWTPTRAGLLIGLDTYMASFPSWNDLYFPTLLRCEKTHFWGYAMTPRGRILGVAAREPVASWHLEYEPGAHRIYTFGLDFLNQLPLPLRHPQNLTGLQAGESKSWTVVIGDVANSDSVNLNAVQPALAKIADAPMIRAEQYTGEPGQTIEVKFWGNPVIANLRTEDGTVRDLNLAPSADGVTSAYVVLPEAFGLCTITATNSDGRVAEASINIRRPWSWYLKEARENAIDNPQKDAGAQCEGYYGFYSMFLAKKWFPNVVLDTKSENKFKEIYPLMFSPATGLPTENPSRIQNSAAMAGILADRYQAGGNITDLNRASVLCDFLVNSQGSDGGYYNGGTNYTSVIYPGKSIMEVMAIEKELGRTQPFWASKYTAHENSVRKAMDHLALSLDNIETEGQATFEDGMISCSATQLGMFALLQIEQGDRQKFTDAAAFFASAHRCLDQIVTPDARQNGGTLRFWEAQYDIITIPNMMSSPHGWSAWNIYSRWYLYQLTGNVEYLRQAMNALGSCAQIIDSASGDLRWAFVSDPFIHARLFVDDPANTNPRTQGKFVNRIVGEQYLPMVSGWCRAPEGESVSLYSGSDGGSNDNDVHEIFKCLEEVALTSAYVVVDEKGNVETWNCKATRIHDTLVVALSETIVSKVHVNAAIPTTVSINFKGQVATRIVKGTSWLESPPLSDAYHQWRQREFGSNYAQNPETLDAADFDKDGIPNLLEYFLDTNPTISKPITPPKKVSIDGGDYFQWEIPANATAPPNVPHIERSTDLKTWTTPKSTADGSVIVESGATWRRVSLRLSDFPVSFFRVVAKPSE